LRRYADLNEIMQKAVEEYIKDVKSENFPSKDESY
jgi:3-methyl-2-oxobutanoate hydroxymethyltransferase